MGREFVQRTHFHIPCRVDWGGGSRRPPQYAPPLFFLCRKTEIGTEVALVTRDSDTTFKVKKAKGQGHRAALLRCTGRPTWTYSNDDLSIYVHDVYRVTTCRPGRGIYWRPPVYSLFHAVSQSWGVGRFRRSTVGIQTWQFPNTPTIVRCAAILRKAYYYRFVFAQVHLCFLFAASLSGNLPASSRSRV